MSESSAVGSMLLRTLSTLVLTEAKSAEKEPEIAEIVELSVLTSYVMLESRAEPLEAILEAKSALA